MTASKPHNNPASVEAVTFLLKNAPKRSELNYYYWYYATLALNQFDGPDSPRRTGKYWGPWKKAMVDAVIETQDKGESQCQTGGWVQPDRWAHVGGPVYTTAGSQYSMEEMRSLTRTLGCDDRVGFTGFQADAPAVMRALDVVVHASTAPEPFGLVLTEAMASSRALVSSAAGGSAEIVAPDVNALVHTPGDPISLADAIGRLLTDAGLRERLGRAGRAHVVDRYDVRAFGERFVRAYEELAGVTR